MAVSRAERRSEREPEIVARFGADRAPVVLDLFEIVEMAWHDSYGEVSPPDDLIADMLLLSDGDLEELIAAARLGLADWRDLRVAAQERRQSR